jgi:hypothetical protein
MFLSGVLTGARVVDYVSFERCTEAAEALQMSLTRFAATCKAERVFGFRPKPSGWIQIKEVATYESP